MNSAVKTSKTYWYLQGARVLFTLPSFFLASAILGFAGLAVEVGIPMLEVAFMNAAIWALPSKLILIASIVSGTSLLTTSIAVALASVRFVLMVASLFPEIRQKSTPTWQLLLLSHFVAITAWVYSFEKIKDIPREMRVVFFAGAGSSLVTFNTLMILATYRIIETFPPEVLGALFFLTPIYFLYSLWRNARDYSVYIAMILGLVLSPLATMLFPQVDILIAGILGGSLATGIYVLTERRKSAK